MCVLFFCGAKKKIQNGAAGEKKFKVRCKKLAFTYSLTYSLNETFFAEQKRKNGAAGKKKKLRYRLDDAVSNPVPHGIPVVQPGIFFFFFFLEG